MLIGMSRAQMNGMGLGAAADCDAMLNDPEVTSRQYIAAGCHYPAAPASRSFDFSLNGSLVGGIANYKLYGGIAMVGVIWYFLGKKRNR